MKCSLRCVETTLSFIAANADDDDDGDAVFFIGRNNGGLEIASHRPNGGQAGGESRLRCLVGVVVASFRSQAKKKAVLKNLQGEKFPHFRFVDWPSKFKKIESQKTLFFW